MHKQTMFLRAFVMGVDPMRKVQYVSPEIEDRLERIAPQRGRNRVRQECLAGVYRMGPARKPRTWKSWRGAQYR